MNDQEHEKALAAHRKAYMEGDFEPGYPPGHAPAAEHRLANAVEYAAYQLGQMNQTLKAILQRMETGKRV